MPDLVLLVLKDVLPAQPVRRIQQNRRLHGLLFGNLPVSTVEKLAKMAQAQKDKVSDPRLAEILTEIEIRAEVELAKLGR